MFGNVGSEHHSVMSASATIERGLRLDTFKMCVFLNKENEQSNDGKKVLFAATEDRLRSCRPTQHNQCDFADKSRATTEPLFELRKSLLTKPPRKQCSPRPCSHNLIW